MAQNPRSTEKKNCRLGGNVARSTNRPTLLSILSEQVERDIRRRPAILDALRVRTTPEQAAILKRWEDGED